MAAKKAPARRKAKPAKRRAIGRPPTYSAALLTKAKRYLSDFEKSRDEALKNNGRAKEVVPTLVGLARHLGVSRETIYAWRKDPNKEAFAAIVDDVSAVQELELVNCGLRGDFAPPVVKMMLSRHGYSDRVENVHSPGGQLMQAAAMMSGMPADEAAKLYKELL